MPDPARTETRSPVTKLTKAQREALAHVVANARPVCTLDEYEQKSPYVREQLRVGFDADGTPIIRIMYSVIDRRTALALIRAGLIRATYSHRNLVCAIPTERGRAVALEVA